MELTHILPFTQAPRPKQTMDHFGEDGLSPSSPLDREAHWRPGYVFVSCMRPGKTQDLGQQELANTQITNIVLEFTYTSRFSLSQDL